MINKGMLEMTSGIRLQFNDYTRIKRDVNAVARGMDRLKAIGNGQVPRVVEAVWNIIG